MTCILYSIFGDHVKEVGTKGEICFSTIFNLFNKMDILTECDNKVVDQVK